MSGIFRWRRVCASLALAALSIPPLAHAVGTPHLVLDVNTVTEPLGSEPYALGQLGSVQLFRATLSMPEVGRAGLVKSDGTAAGTVVLKTFQGKGPLEQRLMAIGTRAFLVAEETVTGSQVWVTDGTADGTRQVTTFPLRDPYEPTMVSDGLRLLAAFGNDLLFTRYSGSLNQLYRTDGTASGTVLLGRITLPSIGPMEYDFAVAGNRIYFTATSETNAVTELWASDGTAAGTKKVVLPGALGANPSVRLLRAVNGGVVFLTSGGSYGEELARIDPATDAISVIDLAPGTSSGLMSAVDLPVLNGYAYFAGTQGNDYELWRSDGTPAGTTLVKDINAGAASSFAPTTDIAKIGDRLIFMANDGSGRRLWGSDGTASGTTLILNDNIDFRYGLHSDSVPVVETRRYRYTPAYAGTNFVTVITDGTPAGTFLLAQTLPNGDRVSFRRAAGDATTEYIGVLSKNMTTSVETYHALKLTAPGQFTVVASSSDPAGLSTFAYVGGKLLIDAYDDTAGQEFWVLDDAGARLLVDLTPQSYTGHSNPQWLTDWNGKLAYSADDGTHGTELWISDGTAAGTKLLADINPGYLNSDPQQLYVWNGALYFFANNGSFRFMRLASPDATPEVLGTLDPPFRLDNGGGIAAARCYLSRPAALGGKLLFAATTAQWGTELWSTDGTAAGTALVADINTNVAQTGYGSLPCDLTTFKDRVYFTADRSTTGLNDPALWSTDGTAAGTRVFSEYPTRPFVFNDQLYFRSATGISRTDGTTAGTVPTGLTGSPSGVTNGKLLFSNHDPAAPTSVYELWASDGTSAGSVRLSDSFNSPFFLPTRVYFGKASNGTQELWSSDGTVTGTQRVRVLGPGTTYAAVNFQGSTLLMITDSAGRTVWRTDGTEAGTTQIGTTALPHRNGLEVGPIVSGQNLFYAGLDNSTGYELYAIPSDDSAAPGGGSGSSGGGAGTGGGGGGSSGGGASSSGDASGGGGGGGGPMRWYDLLALAALLSWRFVRNSRQATELGKNLSPAVNNL